MPSPSTSPGSGSRVPGGKFEVWSTTVLQDHACTDGFDEERTGSSSRSRSCRCVIWTWRPSSRAVRYLGGADDRLEREGPRENRTRRSVTSAETLGRRVFTRCIAAGANLDVDSLAEVGSHD